MQRKSYLMWGIISSVAVIVAGEIFARYYFGLGTPPLSVTHPKIEYMLKPNQNIYRFGKQIIVNQYGMRTAPFSLDKGAGELRLMVYGDSVVNGGSQTDHDELATNLLQNKLSQNRKKVIVGNISAGSWGPGNWLAHSKVFGFFGADIVILVISSHDSYDNPCFSALNKITHPTQNPPSALLEGVTRYLPSFLTFSTTDKRQNGFAQLVKKVSEQESLKGIEDLRAFLELAMYNSTTVLVLQHWEKSEIEGRFTNSGHKSIKDLCESMGITTIELEPYFRRSMENGRNPYRDNIHPNQTGQQLIAEAILENLPKD